jgi:selenocysteine lyase/cysteine desulfurase
MWNRRRFLLSTLAAAIAAPTRRADAARATHAGLPPQDDEAFWRALRRDFTIPDGEAFFNTGTLGASPRAVQEAVIAHLRQVDATIAHWDYRPEHPDYFTGYRPELPLREKLAALVGADADEIALTQNATMGANLMAHGLPLQPGDEVILTDQEHVGCESPWLLRSKRYGIFVKRVRVPVPPRDPDQLVELYEQATTPQTRVWAIPHLTSQLAIRFPVERMCAVARERGILSVIDGAQVIGHWPVRLHEVGCDAYFSSPHKWLLAPKGCGFLYIRRELLPRVWATIVSGQWDNYRDGAYRFMQIGTGNLSLLKGYEAAIDFHVRIGPERVARRIHALADRLRAGLREIPQARIWSPQHPALTSATTVWSLEGWSAGELMDQLWERARVRCRAMGDPYGVRQCVALYNLPEEIERTLATARRLVRERRG